jgi:hypothetical protein
VLYAGDYLGKGTVYAAVTRRLLGPTALVGVTATRRLTLAAVSGGGKRFVPCASEPHFGQRGDRLTPAHFDFIT